MSKRRKALDIVWKRENAGFSGPAGLGVIPKGTEPDECILDCGDQDCQEWPDLWPCDEAGKPTGGNWCHVSECEMLDRPNVGIQPPPEAVGCNDGLGSKGGTMRLSEELEKWRIDRPDEWKMDEFARKARQLEDALRAIAENGGQSGWDGVSCAAFAKDAVRHNVEHQGPTAALSRAVPLDGPVGPQEI